MAAERKIRLDAGHYELRTVEEADVSEPWTQWLNDSETARLLNARPHVATVENLRRYVASFDGRLNHLIGIFEKAGGTLVGFWELRIDRKRKEFLASVLIGETQARGKGAREETRDPLYHHFFNVLGLKAIRCNVAAHNASTLRVMHKYGWELIGVSYKPAANGGYPVELREFRMSREAWLRQRPNADA